MHNSQSQPITDDPYLYEGTDVFANLLGLRDARELAEVEREVTLPRIDALCLAQPALTASAFLALHQAIFKPVYGWAGQTRTVSLALDGADFARPPIILSSLVACFAKLNIWGGYANLTRNEFYDHLAHHISELHAIMPFRVGNRRAIAVHSVQLAGTAGHSLDACIKDRVVWDDALRHSFLTCDHSRITDALLGRAQLQIDVSGPSGLPLLPPRDATIHRRYITTLSKAGHLLREHIAAATVEAAAMLDALTQATTPHREINAARQELGFLRHPKGPLFQLEVLESLGANKLLAVIHEGQSPLEVVREIATAVVIELNEYPQTAIAQASLTLNRSPYLIGGSPHQDRLAAEFLANSAQANLADPRFTTAQRLVDKAISAASRSSGGNTKQIGDATEKARADIAARIRHGDMFDEAASTTRAVLHYTQAV